MLKSLVDILAFLAILTVGLGLLSSANTDVSSVIGKGTIGFMGILTMMASGWLFCRSKNL